MKTILVTGVSKGLGLELVKSLLKDNNIVYGISRSYTDELKNLKEQNDSLLESNGTLEKKNEELNVKIENINGDIIEINGGLNNNSGSITNLQNDKDKVSDVVRVLNADGVAGSLNNYLTRRESKGSN